LLTFAVAESVGYYYEGFLAIQRAVDLSVMSERVKNTSAAPKLKNVDVQLKNFPYPPYLDDKFLGLLALLLSFLLMMIISVTAKAICKNVVLEKENKLKVSIPSCQCYV